ncbi:MAG: FAD-binding oxidoreductase [candidate division WOR-3 bacterium]
MRRRADAVVIGAGIAGSATAYYLACEGLKVLLLDRDFPCAGSTGRCIGGIRQQFTHDLTVRLMIENISIFSKLSDELHRDIEWFQGGYLLLAHSEEKRRTYEQAIAIQQGYGIDVSYISSERCAEIVPGLDRTDLLGGAYCPTDGQASPFYTVYGYIDRMKELGGELLDYTEVVAVDTKGERIAAVQTRKGDKIVTPVVVIATGPCLAETGRLCGLEIPVAAERHESLVTEAVERVFDPMLVDYRSDGCYFVQNYGTGHFIGCYTPVPNIPGLDTSASLEFITEMPRRMVRLVPALKGVRVIRQWAGSYEMTPDGNPIVGETAISGCYVIGGMCGHGFMLGPALGKHLAELVANGESSVDLAEFSLYRTFGKAEALK